MEGGGRIRLDGAEFTSAQGPGAGGGKTGRTFSQGDFKYDGKVDFSDLVILAQHYNVALPAAPAPITAERKSTKSIAGELL